MKIRSIVAPVWSRFAAIILAIAACAGGDERDEADFRGFMVLGDRATNFGLVPGDTLFEQPAERVPAALREDVERTVRRAEYRVGCTRYWSSGSATVVLAARYCYGKALDDQIIGLFDRPASHAADFLLYRQEGGRFVRDPRAFNAFARVCPLARDKRGRVLTECP